MILDNYLNTLKGKSITVIGAGISNKPLIEVLLSANIELTICDKQTRDELGEAAGYYEKSGARLELGKSYLDDINADVIFRTPGIMPWKQEISRAIANGTKLTSEMETFFSICPCKIIGITGSDGKTTTTSIIGQLLKNAGKTAHVGGNIGVPLLTKVDTIKPDDTVVLELSSFQLISMRQSPQIAVVTNLSPNHLDVHKDMDEYINSKRNIVAYQDKSDKAVLNYDNDYTRNYAEATRAEVVFFSRKEKPETGFYLYDNVIYEAIGGQANEVLDINNIKLPGLHNVENYMAALAAVRGMVNSEAISKTAREFNGVAHRIEFVREFNGVKYYNDSIATTPTRAIAALNSFENKVILITGGKGKGLSYDEFAKAVALRTKAIILFGAEAEMIQSAIHNTEEYNNEIPLLVCSELSSAVASATEFAQAGDTVLFSPACTSFDQYRNFEKRGEHFKEIVHHEI